MWMQAIREADPAVLAAAAERLREAMRKKDPSQRRRRWKDLSTSE